MKAPAVDMPLGSGPIFMHVFNLQPYIYKC